MALSLQINDPQDKATTIDSYLYLHGYEIDRRSETGEVRFSFWRSKAVKDRNDGSKSLGRVFTISIADQELALHDGALSQLKYADVVSKTGEINFKRIYDKVKTHNIKWEKEKLNLANAQEA